jgi:hypothetical protein
VSVNADAVAFGSMTMIDLIVTVMEIERVCVGTGTKVAGP